ncbi:Integral membrane protein OS=Tsukamurella paurometabola (strain ATCC 8368 / DSM / CCUG 35730/ CIP 100753 / JCM 10117 / KCTC 9821 / NBRC 16120 / NCIMB 702349/ NCTC 13040) OX=521096 GN=Tpau_1112 PE=4 SV=1 [Tsukamurella paurometabola]|uniref:Integral membrane protein n=1 Tax=Tsukamurella paurometabola (strain ATCC 8368 / DSM 20162 / CCUG 35730 / CIP 100753 / JCM 10117 / KCTC 9821 / NBRC 16120 / NCIMB 702349 / NCTC 13040) TaxID=521096 RepID=D5UVF4_TSUPD|nr:hypothetical protein [Tsukamurella paurometabola]ADG77744.1 conserved hypothetical protein [Tsukamurella paurometabola DSM 20162]SUP28591.1 Uncharacterised protein [Tsukamurella paurometabola]
MTSSRGGRRPAASASTTAAPGTVRAAGVIVGLEGIVALGWGVLELIRGITGAAESSRGAYGMAFWMLPIGSAVLAGGIALLQGKRWGRTLGVLTNLLLGFAGISGAFSQGRPEVGVPMIIVAVVVLGLMFSPPTVAWLEGEYRRDE